MFMNYFCCLRNSLTLQPWQASNLWQILQPSPLSVEIIYVSHNIWVHILLGFCCCCCVILFPEKVECWATQTGIELTVHWKEFWNSDPLASPWDCRCQPWHLLYMEGVKSRNLCVLGNYSTSWVESQHCMLLLVHWFCVPKNSCCLVEFYP